MGMREKLIELLTDDLPHCENPLQFTYDEIVERLADHLIANGVTIPVRCKDCKHWQESVDGIHKWCPLMMSKETKPDDFCSCGERK